jgi:maltose alpha-D-glucosyltransferase/alpha-amylase
MHRRSRQPASAGPLWYKDAVVYELRVRSFHDSDADGIGDLRGLTEKLGYLQDLGVTALWLLPFYPSPLRDDGYDISDYTAVHPACGTLADFARFLEEAHRRGLRVITELVLNHSSDQHPWFQRARRAPAGSPERAFYLWSDTPTRFAEARIIFSDYEPSNWSWDPLARAYYWHRFYAHQPDLNYDNPAVRQAMIEVLDFWLGMGVDGLRLDAIPYLFEREGTSCESLPETHAYLRELRAHVDARFTGRMLLAEANQWPEDAIAYFGQGDECHMAFHFPVMPRIFVAMHLEDRFPIADILLQTPPIPPSCQWALFLRNHDELTLEMVTDEERDAMVRAYAAEPVMRVNLGIRRRLAPLVGNQRRHVELMNALLFSLPGTPFVYYGDEIGMGDNVYLGDRNGVRTPMQWSADKNAGFSRASPQKLELPVIVDPEYHYAHVNVEMAQQSPGSLLWWMKRLIALRKRHPAFGRGSLTLLRPDNPHVLAFVRQHEDDVILVVANLSRFAALCELDLTPWKGTVPVELFGRSALLPVGDAAYPLTLGPRGFYWFSLAPMARDEARAAAYEPPAIEPAPVWPVGLGSEAGQALAEVLAGWAAAQVWFGGRKRRVEEARLVEIVGVGEPLSAHLVLLEIAYDEGSAERYLTAPAVAEGVPAAEIRARSAQAVVATLSEGAVLYDALADGPSARALLEAVFRRAPLPGLAGVIITEARALLPLEETPASVPAGPAPAQPTGATVLFGHRFAVDVARRVDDGASPGLALERFLAAGVVAAPVPALAGAVELQAKRAEPVALVVARAFVPAESDGFAHTASEAHRFFERILAFGRDAPAPPVTSWDVLRLAETEPEAAVRDAVGKFLDTARLLGRRTAELHRALVSTTVPAFLAEPFSPGDQRSVYQSMRSFAGMCLRALDSRARFLPPEVAPLAARVLGRHDAVMRRFSALLGRRLTAPRTRRPGALDLHRVRITGNDLLFADLSGDDARPTAERRRKGSPLRDVAALVASLHEATFATLLDPARVRPEDVSAARPWAHAFWEASAAVLLHAYVEVAGEAGLLPGSADELGALLDAFLLESAFAALSAGLSSTGGPPARLLVPLGLVATLLPERPPETPETPPPRAPDAPSGAP